VTLVQEIDEEKQAGFLIYLPVYRGGQIPETEAERRAALAGFVYAPFRADDLLRGILGGLPQDVDFEIYDGEEARAESLLHRSDGAGAAGGAPGRAGRARFTTTGRMEIGGRAWSLRFATRPEFEAASSRRLALLTLFGGAAVSLALFLVTRAQARARSVAEAAAADLAASRGALSESEERYRTITETASDAIITIDEASRVLFVNRAAEKVFGYGAGEMTGQPLTMLMPDYLRHVHEAGLKRYVETGRRHISWEGVEVPGLHKDGREIPLEVSFGEFVKGGAHYFTGVVRDITERKRAEAALREAHDELEARVEERTRELASANRELERSNRELQDFAFVASHDLQEPLRKIQAFGDLLHGQYAAALGEEGRDFLARMQNAARRMHVLINDLLAFSRVTTKAQPFAPVDLNRVAREVLEDLEARVRQTGGRVEVGPLPTVEADALQMRQLLQNLIGNALKFHRPGEPPAVAVRAEAVGDGHCRLTVEDNGIGFDEKYLDRIFTPFQRLHARGEYEGTGMGLAVCRKIVERHGGQITARSRPGAGTTFIVTLPLKHLEREKD
jgi:PAS domain S-box-containing protein